MKKPLREFLKNRRKELRLSQDEVAEREGIDPATARQKAGRGMLKTAKKIGRNWVIDENEKNIDNRRKDDESSL